MTALGGADGALICKAIVTSNVSVGSAYSRLTDMFRIADVVQKRLLLGWEKQNKRKQKCRATQRIRSDVGARPPGGDTGDVRTDEVCRCVKGKKKEI